MLVLVVVVVATTDTLIVDCQYADRAEQGVCQRCERKRTFTRKFVFSSQKFRSMSAIFPSDDDGEGEC